MKTVVFIILNYNTSSETINCINSIEAIDHYDFSVKYIVVDNHSSDNSIEIFQKYFHHGESVEYIEMKENTGFGRANNIGYKAAVQKYDPEFLIVINSDILIHQRDFLIRVEKLYQEEKFFVLGPDIYVPTLLLHQSPTIKEYHPSILILEKEVEKMKIQLNRLQNDQEKGRNTIKEYSRLNCRIKNIIRNLYCILLKKGYRIKGYNVYLHGAALIFSKDFCRDHPEKCFYPEVYFYGEEDILRYQCSKRNELMLYSPQIQVLHLKSVATYKRWGDGNDINRRINTIRYQIDSKKRLIKLMQEDIQ